MPDAAPVTAATAALAALVAGLVCAVAARAAGGPLGTGRLAELGRAAVQTYVIAHIFAEKLAAAHGEVESLRRQEALIEEEERGEAEAETR